MVNGESKTPEIIAPPGLKEAFQLTCHRFFAPIVFPEPNPVNPRVANITPRMGNFPCIGARCMMWNEERGECWDRTAAKGQALAGEYAFNRMNDVSVNEGGD